MNEQEIIVPGEDMVDADFILNELDALNSLSQMVSRWPLDRRTSHGGKRDYTLQLGYQQAIYPEHIHGRYGRDAIARKAVDAIANDTWKRPPAISEFGDRETPFAQAFNQLANRLKLWPVLNRLDKLARLGRFAILVIGFDDAPPGNPTGAQDMKNPVRKVNGPEGVLYLQPYGEIHINAISWDKNLHSRRYKQPETYSVDVADEETSQGLAFDSKPVEYHHSRIVHVAENTLSSDVFGQSIIEIIWNDLDDLLKTKGGGAEAFWRQISERILVRLGGNVRIKNPQTDPDGSKTKEAIRQRLEQIIHNLSSVELLEGAEDFKVLTGNPADPKSQYDIGISNIAAGIDMPKRKLIGAEAGQLASTQDTADYAATIRSRQEMYAEPMMLRPLIDRFIQYGALPKPKDGYHIGTLNQETGEYEWPPLLEMSDKEKAEMSETRSRGLKAAQEARSQGVPLSDNEVRAYGGLPPLPEAEADKTRPAVMEPASNGRWFGRR